MCIFWLLILKQVNFEVNNKIVTRNEACPVRPLIFFINVRPNCMYMSQVGQKPYLHIATRCYNAILCSFHGILRTSVRFQPEGRKEIFTSSAVNVYLGIWTRIFKMVSYYWKLFAKFFFIFYVALMNWIFPYFIYFTLLALNKYVLLSFATS
jgi:hypothetical protein